MRKSPKHPPRAIRRSGLTAIAIVGISLEVRYEKIPVCFYTSDCDVAYLGLCMYCG